LFCAAAQRKLKITSTSHTLFAIRLAGENMKAQRGSFALHNRNVAPQSKKALQLLQRGLALQQSGKLREAESYYQAVLRDDPDHPEALNLLGSLASRAKNHPVAIELLTRAVDLQPRNILYRNNLGHCLNGARKAREAVPHFRKVIDANPRMVEALMGLANAHRMLGEGEEAEKMLRRALPLAPDNKRLKLLLADVLIDLGRNKDAADIFRAILAADPRNIAAIAGLAAAREAGSEEDDLERFEFALSDPDLLPERKIALHMALGQIYDQKKQPREAFIHFMKGNELDRADYDLKSFRRHIDSLIELFTPFFFMSKTGFGDPSERPLLVVGMPRSGTTLIEQILSSHPLVEGAGELSEIEKIYESVVDHASHLHRNLTNLTDAGCKELAARYRAELDRHSRTALRVVDKMPHNFMQLGFIALLFPRAHIVHCRRDPMDNCVSIFTQRFNKKHSYATDLKMLGLYYREYDRLMNHWRKVLPLKMFDIRYEEMIADQEAISRKLIDFVGLEWDDACLSFHETERTVTTPSRWQVRQPIYTTSVKRWKKYEEFLGPLKESLGDLVDA
jgi:tetratricopeptide (TPR) repeat protein